MLYYFHNVDLTDIGEDNGTSYSDCAAWYLGNWVGNRPISGEVADIVYRDCDGMKSIIVSYFGCGPRAHEG
jgi:hypothetical protein